MFGKALLLAAVGFSTVSCLKGAGADDDNSGGQGSIFSVTVAPSAIAADGKDAAVFDVRFKGNPLTSADVVFYNADDNSVVEMPDMRFTTTEPGDYRFYVTYVNPAPEEGEEAEYKSDVLLVSAVNETINVEPNDQTGLTSALSTTVVQANVDRAVFVVRFDGQVLNAGDYDIYDNDTNRKVTLPTTTVTSETGIEYTLPYYSSSVAETRSFWISYKTSNTIANPLTVTCVNTAIPVRPVDPQPDNLSFRHRVMISQFTGLGCGYCPSVIAPLDAMLADENYAPRFTLAAIHSYPGDPFGPSDDVAGSFGITGAPYVLYDMYYTVLGGSYNYDTNLKYLQEGIEDMMANPAKAGIAARTALDGNTLIVRMVVKAGETGKYRVGAWVLEDGLTGTQTNYGMEGEFNTHNHVLRRADSKVEGSNSYLGHNIGLLNAGDSADYLFTINLDSSWNKDNCNLLLFVSVQNEKGSYYVTNSAETESLTSSLAMEYE